MNHTAKEYIKYKTIPPDDGYSHGRIKAILDLVFFTVPIWFLLVKISLWLMR